VVVNEVLTNHRPKQFPAAVAVEASCQGTSRRPKKPNGREDGIRQEILLTKSPVVTCSPVNQNESIPETADRQAITKSNVHVHCIKVFVFLAFKWTPAVGLTYHGIRPEGWRELATIHPFAIPAILKDLLVVPELPAAQRTMDLLRRPVGLLVGSIGRVTRANRREIGPLVMEQLDDCITRESRQEMRCLNGWLGGWVGCQSIHRK
jgi:hypothetical protein